MPRFIHTVLTNRKATAAVAAILISDSLLFGGSDARKVPSFMVIVAFLALLLTFATVWYAIFSVLGLYGVHFRHKRRLSIYMSGLISGIIALQSIGELSKRDIIVLLPLILLGYLYSAYSRSTKRGLE